MNERVPLRVWLVLSAGLAVLGSSAILIRYASGAPGLVVATWRTVFAVVLIAPVCVIKSHREIRALPLRDLLLIGIAGVLLGMHFIMWIESLYHTSVASASVLVSVSPIFIAVLGFVFLKEHLSIRTVVAVVVAVGGAVMISQSDSGAGEFANALWGNSLALSGALLFAVYILIGRAVRQRTGFLAYLFPLYLIAALTCLAGAVSQGLSLVQPPYVMALCLLMALGPQILGHGAFNYAVRYLPAAKLGLLSLTEPIGASILALLLFGEIPTATALLGMLIVLCAIAFVLARRGVQAVN